MPTLGILLRGIFKINLNLSSINEPTDEEKALADAIKFVGIIKLGQSVLFPDQDKHYLLCCQNCDYHKQKDQALFRQK